jgi:hypothetical protein
MANLHEEFLMILRAKMSGFNRNTLSEIADLLIKKVKELEVSAPIFLEEVSTSARLEHEQQNPIASAQPDFKASEGLTKQALESIDLLKTQGLSEVNQSFGLPSSKESMALALGGKGEMTINAETILDTKAQTSTELDIPIDPKTLWKDLPSDSKNQFWKPDDAFLTLQGQQRQLIGASIRGRSHAHKGLYRDDDFALGAYGIWSAVVVADGGGSYPMSRRGSQLACESVQRELETVLGELNTEFQALLLQWVQNRTDTQLMHNICIALYPVLVNVAFLAFKQLEQEAQLHNQSINHYNTTLAIGIQRRYEFGDFVAGFGIGDSAVVALDQTNQKVTVLNSLDIGEHAAQTVFLGQAQFRDSTELKNRIHFDVFDNLTALIAVTDGIVDPKFGTLLGLNSFERWDNLWQEIKDFPFDAISNTNLGEWLRFWSKGDHDDRTIALIR